MEARGSCPSHKDAGTMIRLYGEIDNSLFLLMKSVNNRTMSEKIEVRYGGEGNIVEMRKTKKLSYDCKNCECQGGVNKRCKQQ